MRRSAELGFAFAQVMMAVASRGDERYPQAQNSGSQRERDDFYGLGICFENGFGIEKNLDKAKENFLVAAAGPC